MPTGFACRVGERSGMQKGVEGGLSTLPVIIWAYSSQATKNGSNDANVLSMALGGGNETLLFVFVSALRLGMNRPSTGCNIFLLGDNPILRC